MLVSGILGASAGKTAPVPVGMIDHVTPVPGHAQDLRVRGGTAAPAPSVPPTPAPVIANTGGLIYAHGDTFYFRIWPIPGVLDAQNPKYNVDIPFQLWNAFLVDNTIVAINETGTDGLTIDTAPGLTVDALGLRTVNVQITPEAPSLVDAFYRFVFEHGAATVEFIAQLADVLPIAPDGLKEEYAWLTNVIQSYNGTEQRIAIRTRARRTISYDMTLLDDTDRKLLYDKIYKTMDRSVIVPIYQYATRLKQNAPVGTDLLYCNPSRSDIRTNDSVVLITKDGLTYVFRAIAVGEDYVRISSPLANTLKKGAIVMGGFSAQLANGAGLSMQNLGGSSNLVLTVIESRETLARPDNGIALATFDGIPLLERIPLGSGNPNESFDAGIEIIDNNTGVPYRNTAWDQKYIAGSRRFVIDRLFNPLDLEWWKTFLDHCRGQQRSFLMPTYRHDLTLFGVFVGTQIEVAGTEYSSLYGEVEAFRRLWIDTDRGVYMVYAAEVLNNGASTVIKFRDTLAGDFSGIVVNRISYLQLCRLGSDQVTLTHSAAASTIEFPIRTVKA